MRVHFPRRTTPVEIALLVAGGAVCLAAAGPTGAAPPVRQTAAFTGPSARHASGRRGAVFARRAGVLTPEALPAPAGCSTNVSPYFLGLTDAGDYAGGNTGAGFGSKPFGYAGVLAGADNVACDDLSAIGGGDQNTLGGENYARFSFIGGGYFNALTGSASVIGSGFENVLSYAPPYSQLTDDGNGIFTGSNNVVAGPFSMIGAGTSNSIVPSATSTPSDGLGQSAFIGAGEDNAVGANYASIVGGSRNSLGSPATSAGDYGFIGGGQENAVTGEWGAIPGGIGGKVSGTAAAVGGGEANLASGTAATVPGGYHNVASGSASFAAGAGAEAVNNGAFVWSDEASTTRVKSTLANEFLARASGGVYFYSNAASTAGVRLAAGSGAWSSLSDRNMKTGVAQLDDAAVLDKVAALPVSVWSYRSEPGVRHLGPMAQDFYAAFRVGEDDRHIASIDEDGVALAAIKALRAQNARLHAENAGIRADLIRLRERMEVLRSRDAARLDLLEREVSRLGNVAKARNSAR